MTTEPRASLVEVEQVDRDAAALLYDTTSWPNWDRGKQPHSSAGQHIKDGKGDASPYTQAFARHRLEALRTQGDGEGLLQRITDASFSLAIDAGGLVVATDGDEALSGHRKAVLYSLKAYKEAHQTVVDRIAAPAQGDGEAIGWERGMRDAAEICGSLAETTYDDADAFEAATGCEAAIISDLNLHRQNRLAAPTQASSREER